MADMMTFPDTVEEFMEEYKLVDTEQVYTNGTALVPIFRMKQWFEHENAQLSPQCTTSDLISRQAVIKVLESWQEALRENSHYASASDLSIVVKDVKELSSVQPEPAIPLSWIEKHIEWHKSLDNEFANLAAAHISVMVKKWRDEQNETD